MYRIPSILIAAALAHGCAWEQTPQRAREAAATATEPIALSRSLDLDDKRTQSPVTLSPVPEDDPLPLKATLLHPELGIGDRAFRQDQAEALNGDGTAAMRVAQMFRKGSNGVPRDERRMVHWLRLASDLHNGSASYELYLHYLGRGLDRAAVRFEKRALEQGYVPPPRLDQRRG